MRSVPGIASVLVALHAVHHTSAQVLAAQRFDYNNLPEKADTSSGDRGPQYGYNRCGPDTEGPNSLCQTALINSVDGTLKGVQFMRTPNYVQVTGLFDQTKLNMLAGDSGGELDPHGADQRGNPIGGLLFSDAWGQSSSGAAFQQVINWHNFMGSNVFCLKACDPSWDYDYRMCEHVYDRAGCAVNAPAAYREGVFESCLGDDQLAPGIYTNEQGQTLTWTQPPEGTPIGELPYVPFTPASSQCTAYQSAALYNGQPVSDGASGPVPTGMSGSLSASVSVSATTLSDASSMANSTISSSMASLDSSSFASSTEPSSSSSFSSAVVSSSAMSSSTVMSSSAILSSSSSAMPSAPVVTQIVTADVSTAAEPASQTSQPTSSASRVAISVSAVVVFLGAFCFVV
ncbi:hypothetical protein OIV83_002494 [Microbotryomycetes sp. JL201]|nr:hypothetical protein OIV83_002494 [Microbotryomycetes sp. JL201]